MFKLIWYLMFLPFYMMIWLVQLYVFIFRVIIKIFERKNSKKDIKNWNVTDEIISNTDYQIYKNNIKEYEGKLLVNRKKDSDYELIRPEENQYKTISNNIENIYKEFGYNVRVVNIEKNRYNTAYEVIFSKNETSQYEILTKSDIVKSKFTIDGVDIKPKKKSDNRIVIYIPLELKEISIFFNDDGEGLRDPFLDEAIEYVIQIGYATASIIQNRFKIGYARAGRIIDQMEERGVISGYNGSKPRDVLISKETWQRLKDRV